MQHFDSIPHTGSLFSPVQSLINYLPKISERICLLNFLIFDSLCEVDIILDIYSLGCWKQIIFFVCVYSQLIYLKPVFEVHQLFLNIALEHPQVLMFKQYSSIIHNCSNFAQFAMALSVSLTDMILVLSLVEVQSNIFLIKRTVCDLLHGLSSD